MPPVVAIIKSAKNSALIFEKDVTNFRENNTTMLKSKTVIDLVNEVNEFDKNMLLKANSATTKFFIIKNNEAIQARRQSK